MRSCWSLQMAAAAVGLLLGAGCGESDGYGVGFECSSNDACEAGLSCLRQYEYDPDTDACVAGKKYCTIACDADETCTTELGAGHICIDVVGSPFRCAPGLCFEGSRGP